ncbi:phosphomethylpyrimidine synthase ThiC [Caldicellulosiruptoraceae bacterium PP1]
MNSKTIMRLAKENTFNDIMLNALNKEEIEDKVFIKKLAEGKIVIPANKNRKRKKYFAIGEGLKVKINANIGVSKSCSSFEEEMKKAELCQKLEVESVMDLSSGIDSYKFRKELLNNFDFIVGTVPVYDIAILNSEFTKITKSQIIETIEKWAEEGVDFFTIHAGLTRKTILDIDKSERILKIVSRGGAMIYQWMLKNNSENPLYEYFDEIVKICKKHDVVISLGDALRPGAISDATDKYQIEELITLGELTQYAWQNDVQVIIEGPGHMRANEIAANMILEKKLCGGAPFYVLGPLTTDIAAGYDHISGAMGALIAALNGADFLCYVTPAEHLRLPTYDDVKEGIIAFKIAAHSANIAKGIKSELEKDIIMSKARANFDWGKMINTSIYPPKAKEYSQTIENKECTMCGELCAIKNSTLK